MSNRRKLKLRGHSGKPLPECHNCDSVTVVTVVEEDGPVVINLQPGGTVPVPGIHRAEGAITMSRQPLTMATHHVTASR